MDTQLQTQHTTEADRLPDEDDPAVRAMRRVGTETLLDTLEELAERNGSAEHFFPMDKFGRVEKLVVTPVQPTMESRVRDEDASVFSYEVVVTRPLDVDRDAILAMLFVLSQERGKEQAA